MIQDYMREICDILAIPIPYISYETNAFPTETMMAQYNWITSTIHLRRKEPDPDYLFAIAHELRHIWQIQTDKQAYLTNYQTIDKIGVDSYNLQPAELDANAFAMIIMQVYFDLQPQFLGIAPHIITEIKKRASIIYPTLNI